MAHPVPLVFLSLSFIFGVLSNTAIIFVNGFISRNRYLHLRRLSSILAISDLLKTLSLNPLYIKINSQKESSYLTQDLSHSYHGIFGESTFACRLIPSIWYLFNYISLAIYVIIVVDQTSCQVLSNISSFFTSI